jgi:hypothetical protein
LNVIVSGCKGRVEGKENQEEAVEWELQEEGKRERDERGRGKRGEKVQSSEKDTF